MTLDAVARLLLAEAGAASGRTLVLEDSAGSLTAALTAAGERVSSYCDDLRDAEAVAPAQRLDVWDADALVGVDRVLLRLPKSLGALEDHCQVLTQGDPGLRLIAGARTRHMTPAQNDVLGRYFGSVRASLGRDKSRVLHATGPLGTPPAWPRSRVDQTLGLVVWANGSTFNTTRLDAGTALLARALAAAGVTSDGVDRAGRRALDLGCGSGILTALLARAGWSVDASDVSAAAVASARLTARANGVDVDAVRRDGLVGVPDGSYDLIVTNPPFHRGTAKDSTPALAMIRAARAALRPGGEVWLVFNSHLPYLSVARSAVGPSEVVVQDRSYTVVRSRA